MTEVTSETQIKVKGFDETITDNTGVAFSRTLCYKIEDCVVNEAGFEFDIDGIAQIGWSGIGKIITEVPVPTPTVTEGITSTTNLIRNRLTKLAISSTSPTTSDLWISTNRWKHYNVKQCFIYYTRNYWSCKSTS